MTSRDDAAKIAWSIWWQQCRDMNQEVYAKTIGHQAHFEAGFRAGGDRVLDEFYDEGGLPIHFPMGVNAKGQGPVNDSDAHHWVCWCNDDRCMWNQALLSNRKTE